MALFKKKSKTADEPSDFEETLVAEHPPEPTEPRSAATLTDEPVDEEPEPLSTRTEIPDQREDVFPSDIEPYLKREPRDLILLEKNFDRPLKLSVEGKVTSSPRQSLHEKTWHPAHKTTLAQIQREVDKLVVKPYKRKGTWLRTQFREPKPGRRMVIPPNILAKRIVYETEGGFVIEVTYREGAETRKTFFTMETTGGRTKALEQVQSGKYALATSFSDEKIGPISAPKRGAKLPTPPGKVNTYPILNKWDVLEIEGIGDKYARRLHELGILTTDQLRLMNATVIANNLGAAPATVQSWQQMAELMLVEGIGKQFAEILVKSGITGIDDLKKQHAKQLSRLVKETNNAGKIKITGRSIQPKKAQTLIMRARKMHKELQPFPNVEA